MALHYDLTKIANTDTTCWLDADKRQMNPITEALIWGTLAVDLGRITEKNAADFHRRLVALHRLGASATVVQDGPGVVPEEADEVLEDGRVVRVPTLQEVRAHIGLATNVRDVPLAAFQRKLGRMAYEGRLGFRAPVRSTTTALAGTWTAAEDGVHRDDALAEDALDTWDAMVEAVADGVRKLGGPVRLSLVVSASGGAA